MFFLYLFRWFSGYVYFKTNGGFFERFLNLCASRNISIWKTKIKNGDLYGRMLAKDYKHIRHFAYITQIHPRIIKKCGLKYRLLKYKGRYGIIAGIIAFLLIINTCSMFIWNVNVMGNSKVSSEKIISALKKCGVYEGVLRKNVNAENVRQQLLINMPELSWAAINTDGCFTDIDVRETNEKKLEHVTDYPANIVAKQGGTVLSIKAYYGVPEIKIGEAVAKGDMLVSGTVLTKTGSIIYTKARAEIMAQTVHTVSARVNFKQTNLKSTGEKKSRKIVELFGVKIPLFLGEVQKPYTVKRSVIIPEINKKRLPVKLYVAEFEMQKKVSFSADTTTAKKQAYTRAVNRAKKQLGKIIVKQDAVKYTVDKSGVGVLVYYICKEDIANPKKIVIN